MAVFLVKSTDGGAPSLVTNNGGFITVADYALVTVAGYTKTFSGTNKAIYRPPNGLGYSVRFVHDSAVSGFSYGMTVRGLESASGIDTFTNPYPSSSQVADNLSTWILGTAAAQTRPYFFLISDGATSGIPPFIFFSADASNGNIANPYFWGEVSPQENTDNYCSLIVVRNTTLSNGVSASYTICAGNSIGNVPKIFWARSRDGSIISSTGYISTRDNLGSSGAAQVPPHPDTGGIIKLKIPIGDSYSTALSGSFGTNNNIIRGWLPCIWNVFSPIGNSAFNLYDLFRDGQYNSNASFMFVPVGSITTPNLLLIETTATWSKPII